MKKNTSKIIFSVSNINRLLAMLFLMSFMPSTQSMSNQPDSPALDIEKNWGIKILGIRVTAANYMVDFRYRVIDPEKAQPLFIRKIRPQLINRHSGARMGVYSSPKTGPMRTTNQPKVGRNYFILFANPGRHIKAGDKVSVVIGNFKVEDLIVE